MWEAIALWSFECCREWKLCEGHYVLPGNDASKALKLRSAMRPPEGKRVLRMRPRNHSRTG